MTLLRTRPILKGADESVKSFITAHRDEIAIAKLRYVYKDRNYISDGPTGWTEDETPLYSWFRVDMNSSAWSFFGCGKDLETWLYNEEGRAARWDKATLTLDNGVLRGTYCELPLSIEDNHSLGELRYYDAAATIYVGPIYRDERGHWRQWNGPVFVDPATIRMGWW